MDIESLKLGKKLDSLNNRIEELNIIVNRKIKFDGAEAAQEWSDFLARVRKKKERYSKIQVGTLAERMIPIITTDIYEKKVYDAKNNIGNNFCSLFFDLTLKY